MNRKQPSQVHLYRPPTAYPILHQNCIESPCEYARCENTGTRKEVKPSSPSMRNALGFRLLQRGPFLTRPSTGGHMLWLKRAGQGSSAASANLERSHHQMTSTHVYCSNSHWWKSKRVLTFGQVTIGPSGPAFHKSCNSQWPFGRMRCGMLDTVGLHGTLFHV